MSKKTNKYVNENQLLSKSAYTKDGVLRSFNEQLNDYAFEEMPSGDMFIISESSKSAGIEECADLPIVMKQSIIKKISVDHELSLGELKQLPNWLHEYPLALESLSDIDSLLLIADAKDLHGNDILIALHLEKEYRQIQINEISSIYGKKNLAYLIENTFAAGKNIYVNERTGNWLQHSGLPLPERIVNHLSNEIIALNSELINNEDSKTCTSPGLSEKEAETREALNALSENRTTNDAIDRDDLII